MERRTLKAVSSPTSVFHNCTHTAQLVAQEFGWVVRERDRAADDQWLDATRWADEVWRTRAADDFVTLVERELLFAAQTHSALPPV